MIDINEIVEFIHRPVFWTEQTVCKWVVSSVTQRCADVSFSGWVQLHTFPPED